MIPATTRYLIVLCDLFGIAQEFLDNYSTAEVVLNENDIGALSLVLPDDYNPDLFASGALIYVYRAAVGEGYRLLGDTAFKINGVKFALNEQGEQTIQVEAEGMLAVLRDTAIPYQEGNAYTLKLGAADDLAKAFVRENRGSLATDTARNVTQLSVAANLTLGAVLLKDQTSKRSVLEVVKELSDQSAMLGTWIGYGLVAADIAAGTFRFETYSVTSDVDRRYPDSPNPLLLGPYYGNVANVELFLDYGEDANVIYAAGSGSGDLQPIATAIDTAEATAGPFARREKVINASAALDATSLADEANGALQAARPKILFGADLVDGDSIRYDVDYRLGTLLTIEYQNRLYDCRISQVAISLAHNSGGEQITIRAENL